MNQESSRGATSTAACVAVDLQKILILFFCVTISKQVKVKKIPDESVENADGWITSKPTNDRIRCIADIVAGLIAEHGAGPCPE